MADLGNLAKGKYGGKAKYVLRIDSMQAGVEEKYFSLINFLGGKIPFGRNYTGDIGKIIKTKDVFGAGETSAYWGVTEQRKGLQIDKFQGIMSNIGSMVKTLFQLLRELRILEERLSYYEEIKKGSKSAEVALKGTWVDMVEGGAEKRTSVLGMAAQPGFVTLPDLFFSVHPKTKESVDREVAKLKDTHGINRKVREVLGRKLHQYLTWKEKTYHELKVGERFRLNYLRQHYSVIKLYLNWLRPYLKNIKRLNMIDATKDKDVIAAFETSKTELEFLAVKDKYELETPRGKVIKKFKNIFPCVKVRLNFVAMPQMAFQKEYQQGAIHRGRTEIIIEGLSVTKEDLEKYQKELDKEDMELLASVDSSIEAMKEDLDYYLKKGGAFDILEERKEKKVEKERWEGTVLEPFVALGDFFKEITGVRINLGGKDKTPVSEKKAAEEVAKTDAYLAYYVFKKQHKMITEW